MYASHDVATDEVRVIVANKADDARTGAWYSVLCHGFSVISSEELYKVQEKQGGRMHRLISKSLGSF